MMREIAFEIGFFPDLTATSFTDAALRAQILIYLNRGKEAAVRKVPLDILSTVMPFETVAEYTTGTVTTTAGDTTVTGVGTTWTAAMVGRQMQIGTDLVPYEIVGFTDTTHVEIDRPYTGTAQAAVTYKIYQDVYAIPPEVSQIIDIRRPGDQRVLGRKTRAYIDTRYPNPLQAGGEPRVFCVYDYIVTRDPATGTYAADASTDSDTIIESSLAIKTREDYYKDWYVYNTTRLGSSRITAFNVATTALSLETPITGQVVTDTFYLKKRELRVKLRPTPLANYNYLVSGVKAAKIFVNDADYETEIDEDYEDGLIYQAIAEYYKPRDLSRAASFEALADKIWEQLAAVNADMPVSGLRFNGGADGLPRIEAFGNSMSYHEPY